MKTWLPALALLLLPACQLFGEEQASVARTYPPADPALPRVTVIEAGTTVPVPGRYNVEAFVTAVHECPPDARCFVADYLAIADQRDEAGEGITLHPEKPGQFIVGARYLMSVQIDTMSTASEQGVRRFNLLGYDRVR